MVVHCKYKEYGFVGGESYPQQIIVKDYMTSVTEGVGVRLCSEYASLFRRERWPEGDRIESTYKLPDDPGPPTWEAGKVIESVGDANDNG